MLAAPRQIAEGDEGFKKIGLAAWRGVVAGDPLLFVE